jgi:hypothetical protein
VDVVPDPLVRMSSDDRRTWHDTLIALSDMYRVSRAAMATLDRLAKENDGVREEISALQRIFRGEPARGLALTPGPPALAQQISQLLSRIEASSALPTADQQRLTLLSHERLANVVDRLNKLKPSGEPLSLAPLPAGVRR